MNEHHHEHTAVTPQNETHIVRDRLPRISWGAVFAGLVVALGISWLMHLLGAAMGLSIADATDVTSMGEGVAGGTALWMIVSWVMAFFVGSLVAARLCGSIDDLVGMLHGCTLWGAATLIIILLGYYGISSLLQTGQELVASTAHGFGTIASGTASAASTGAEQTVATLTSALDAEFTRKVRDRLTDEAAEAAAGMQQQLSEQAMLQSIEQLDQRTIRRMVQDLMNQDTEGAAQLLSANTNLSDQDAKALVQGAYQQLEQQFGDATNQESLQEDLQNQLAQQIDDYVAQLDTQGGSQVTEQDVRDAINQLDAGALQSIAMSLVQGDAQGVKRTLAQNTNLSNQQIEDLYAGFEQGTQQQIEEYQAAVDQAVETASDYAQTVLWLSFAGAAIALAVSLGGGWLGTSSARQSYDTETVVR